MRTPLQPVGLANSPYHGLVNRMHNTDCSVDDSYDLQVDYWRQKDDGKVVC